MTATVQTDRAGRFGEERTVGQRRAINRVAHIGCGLAAFVMISGCSTTSQGNSAPPAATQPATPTTTPFDRDTWTADNQDMFDEATSAMTRFADAVETGDVEPAEEAASEARLLLEELATVLDADTRQAAIDLRSEFVDCSLAYGAVGEALENTDPEAFEASAPLFRRCLGIASVDQP